MAYSKKVIEHFKNSHNQGVIKNADVVGKVGSPVCGDVVKIYIKFDKKKEIIKNIKFETLGCAAAIATSSVLTDLVKGKTVKEALSITKERIVKELGGLPVTKIHCSMLGIEALNKAINNKNKFMTIEEKIKKSLKKISLALRADGGDVVFVGWNKKTGVVVVELVGMCSNCPMANVTLKNGIEVEMKKDVPEVKAVVSV